MEFQRDKKYNMIKSKAGLERDIEELESFILTTQFSCLPKAVQRVVMAGMKSYEDDVEMFDKKIQVLNSKEIEVSLAYIN